ncbi:MAG: glycoside hydrolase family 16 protein [Verrucomicrobiales bacterium]|nr:glycoside hydrolase family 16 protein [Verrucomicrobiales bacterium]
MICRFFSGLLLLSVTGHLIAGENAAAWVLTFEDEFDGPKLDYDKWTPEDPWGVERNDELQGYVIQAFEQNEGILQIRCEKKPTFYDGRKRDYRSGMMTTYRKFSQTFGKFEMRCRVPRGQGLWPAIWLLPDPLAWPPEIDILEILGHETDRVYLSNHWIDPDNPDGDSGSQTGEYKGPDFSEDFHTFGVEWESGEIRWYVDGVLRHKALKNVPEEPMYILVNLAVGGWAEAPDASTVFPAVLEIDYVRVWERE